MYIYTHTHTHIKLNHFVVHLKLTQHCESTALQFLKRFWNILHREPAHYLQKPRRGSNLNAHRQNERRSGTYV